MTPGSFEELVAQITPEMHSGLRRAVELGRLPDRRRLERAQQAEMLQVLLAWEKKNLPDDQQAGFIQRDRCEPEEQEQCVTIRPAGE